MVRSLVAVLLLSLPAAAIAAEPSPPLGDLGDGSGWKKVAGTPCVVAGRPLELAVLELDAPAADGGREVSFMGDACLSMSGVPVTCLSFLTEGETLAAGVTHPARTFAVRCVPESRKAWILAWRWSDAGLALEAWRMDLEPLASAEISYGGEHPEVLVPDGKPILPTPVVTWSAPAPVPGPRCSELSVDMVGGDRMLDLVVAPQAGCQGWKVRFDAELGGSTASPLAATGVTADAAPGSQAKAEPPAKASGEGAEASAAKEAKPAQRPQRGLSSFSRR